MYLFYIPEGTHTTLHVTYFLLVAGIYCVASPFSVSHIQRFLHFSLQCFCHIPSELHFAVYPCITYLENNCIVILVHGM